jgi:hypothetical protein
MHCCCVQMLMPLECSSRCLEWLLFVVLSHLFGEQVCVPMCVLSTVPRAADRILERPPPRCVWCQIVNRNSFPRIPGAPAKFDLLALGSGLQQAPICRPRHAIKEILIESIWSASLHALFFHFHSMFCIVPKAFTVANAKYPCISPVQIQKRIIF